MFGINFTGQILSECSGDVMQIKAAIFKADKEYSACLVKCSPLHSGCCKSAGWSRLWDLTYELGLKTVSGLQMLSRALGHPTVAMTSARSLELHWKELHLPKIGAAWSWLPH